MAQDRAPVARRVAATAQLAAQEYRVGVVDGRVVAKAEVEEATLFLQEARRSAALLPAEAGQSGDRARSTRCCALVAETAPPDSLDARVRSLGEGLTTRLGVTLDELPSLDARRSPAAPRSTRRTAPAAMAPWAAVTGPWPPASRPRPRTSPTGRRFATSLRSTTTAASASAPSARRCRRSRAGLPAEDRWAAALYASVLRLPAPRGEVPPSLRAFATSGKMSDDQVLAALGAGRRRRSRGARPARRRAHLPGRSHGRRHRARSSPRCGASSTRRSPWPAPGTPRRARARSTPT